MIEIKNLNYRHGPVSVLKDINLQIPRGGITALIGPNGAGKSTLLSLMARLRPLQTGTIVFDGMDITKTPANSLARKLAILQQDATVASRITVRELVGFGRYPYHHGRQMPDDLDKVQMALEEFDLLPFAERFMDELSGGQRQRALVAMAYCQETDYLLLDEPLNNLDMHFARSLMNLLRDLADNNGRSVVIVLHDINYAAAFADTIVALKDGHLIAHGPPEKIVEREQLRAVYDMDIAIMNVGGKPVALHHTPE